MSFLIGEISGNEKVNFFRWQPQYELTTTILRTFQEKSRSSVPLNDERVWQHWRSRWKVVVFASKIKLSTTNIPHVSIHNPPRWPYATKVSNFIRLSKVVHLRHEGFLLVFNGTWTCLKRRKKKFVCMCKIKLYSDFLSRRFLFLQSSRISGSLQIP